VYYSQYESYSLIFTYVHVYIIYDFQAFSRILHVTYYIQFFTRNVRFRIPHSVFEYYCNISSLQVFTRWLEEREIKKEANRRKGKKLSKLVHLDKMRDRKILRKRKKYLVNVRVGYSDFGRNFKFNQARREFINSELI
jgi:hypothetical protein